MVQVERGLSFVYRSRVEIIVKILREAVGGSKKTHIMYKSNLSSRQLQIYMSLLLDRGLLKVVSGKKSGEKKVFITTAKGRSFLQAYRDLEALLTS